MGGEQGAMIFQERTVREYLLEEDKTLIDIILKHVNPKKVITSKFRDKVIRWEPKVGTLYELEYKHVIVIKQQLQNPTLEAMNVVLRSVYRFRTQEQFLNCSVFDVFAAYTWIVEEVKGIYEVERQKLYREPTQKQKNAGIEEFEQLDDIPAIDDLAGGDVTKWDEILELPYGQILRKMLLSRIQKDYNERLMQQK